MEPKSLRSIFLRSKADEIEVLERIMQLDPKRRPSASEVNRLVNIHTNFSLHLSVSPLDTTNGIFR